MMYDAAMRPRRASAGGFVPVVAMLAMTACGRVGFDARTGGVASDATGGDTTGDAADALTCTVAPVVPPTTGPPTTVRIGLGACNAVGDGGAVLASLSSGVLAFESAATNLVSGDGNSADDIFARDLTTGAVERISAGIGGGDANGASNAPAISADGRLVAFESVATNLTSPSGQFRAVYLRDRTLGTTELVSATYLGTPSSGFGASISADGSRVAFASNAFLTSGSDANAQEDIFMVDRVAGTVTLVSQSTTGVQANFQAIDPAISADGSAIAFISSATDLVANDTNLYHDAFVRDLSAGTTTRVSVSSTGTEGNGASDAVAISSDGKIVAFAAYSNNLVANDTNNNEDVFVKDRTTGTTTRISVATAGTEANSLSTSPSISADGNRIAFVSYASNLVAGDGNGLADVFLHDRTTGQTLRVSVSTSGGDPDGDSSVPAISADGHYVAFISNATNLIAGDTNGAPDLFIYGPIP
jgi:Tol biopolymer transport system component